MQDRNACACVRGVVSDGRAGRQVADADMQLGRGVDWVQLATGTRVRTAARSRTPPTDPSVRWSLACCSYGRGWAHKKKKRIRDEKISGGWVVVGFAFSLAGTWTRRAVGVVRTRPSAFCPNGHGWAPPAPEYVFSSFFSFKKMELGAKVFIG